MKYHVVSANPAGNITLIVKDYVEPEQRAEVANMLLAMENLHAEQVGFEEEPVQGGVSRLCMMGGEFCGNASRSFGYYLAKKQNIHEGSILIEISGCEKPLQVTVNTQQKTAMTQMPCDMTMREMVLKDIGTFPFIEMEGISHLVIEKESISPQETEQLLEAVYRQVQPEALGILCLVGNKMTPAVYVAATKSLVYESSCGSGSVAASYYLTQLEKNGMFKYSIQQPGGNIEIVLQKKEGKIISCSMGGEISVSDEKLIETVSLV